MATSMDSFEMAFHSNKYDQIISTTLKHYAGGEPARIKEAGRMVFDDAQQPPKPDMRLDQQIYLLLLHALTTEDWLTAEKTRYNAADLYVVFRTLASQHCPKRFDEIDAKMRGLLNELNEKQEREKIGLVVVRPHIDAEYHSRQQFEELGFGDQYDMFAKYPETRIDFEVIRKIYEEKGDDLSFEDTWKPLGDNFQPKEKGALQGLLSKTLGVIINADSEENLPNIKSKPAQSHSHDTSEEDKAAIERYESLVNRLNDLRKTTQLKRAEAWDSLAGIRRKKIQLDLERKDYRRREDELDKCFMEIVCLEEDVAREQAQARNAEKEVKRIEAKIERKEAEAVAIRDVLDLRLPWLDLPSAT